jgi:hypothetical protein
VKNTLAYFNVELIMTVKSVIGWALEQEIAEKVKILGIKTFLFETSSSGSKFLVQLLSAEQHLSEE